MQIKNNRVIQSLLKGRWIFLIMLLSLAISVWMESQTGKRFYGQEDTNVFQKVLHKKEMRTDSILGKIISTSKDTDEHALLASLSHEYSGLSKDGIAVFLYRNDTLLFWSDNIIPVPFLLHDFPVRDMVGLANSFFIRREKKTSGFDAIGLILIKKEYPYENRFLKSGFQDDFSLSPEVKIQPKRSDNGQNAVFNSNGNFLFTLDYNISLKENLGEKQVSALMYLIVFVLFLFFLRRFIHNAIGRYKNIVFLFSVVLLFGLYYFLHYFRLPDVIFNLELFSPGKFAQSEWFPSLGDLLLLSAICLFTVFNFYKEFIIDLAFVRKSAFLLYLLMAIFAMLIIGWFSLTSFLFRSLILDSTISFETYKVLDLTVFTFIGFVIIVILFTTLSLLTDKIMGILKNSHKNREALFLLAFMNLVILVSLFTKNRIANTESAVFFLILSVLIYFMRFTRKGNYRFSGFVSFVLLFSVFTVFEVVRYTGQKSQTDMKIKAVNLSTEHDPIAELLFVDVDARLRKDQEIREMVFAPKLDFDKIYASLQRKYFSGFWDKYELQVTLCRPEDSLYVAPPDDEWYHCYDFFSQILSNDGVAVPNSSFYYLDNLNGRISYIGAIPLQNAGTEVSVYIELNSRLISEGLGYPELLLDDKFNPSPSSGDYSYAKYSKGRLVSFSGDFAYYMSSSIYTDGKMGWAFVKKDNHDHLIYNVDGSNTIIVSKPSVFWVDILISFSYVFSFYFLLMVLFLLISNISPVSTNMQWNFKNKIQLAITSLLFFSLLCIGAGVVYFSIRQYKAKHVEILQEKIQSVYVELIHTLEFEKSLQNWSAPGFYNLDELLGKFSNVFYSDINMYDEKGMLLATSRREIIENKLVSGRMDTQAYLEMAVNRRSEFIHNENIGGLQYLSAYVPFVNSENKLLAYLNLPYFTRQDELTSEITNLVVAIINIMVLLSLLSFTIAVFLSNKLTSPLKLLQESFARVSLDSKNEKINYKAHDEIGSLVSEYNKMVDQLSSSAEMLAKSERELAWREMAKQIAHEIKNPLTPMRLSIQHLQRSLLDKRENWEEQFNRLSKMLIEQIDDLSAIATEFSSFAKMPAAQNEKIDLVQKLTDTCRLFENTENVKIQTNFNGIEVLEVFLDREQISRVFINLIKNAIQSMPDNKQGDILVSLEKKEDLAIIRFQDNGKGIPEDIRDKLFQPNFTTKTGGMGMGLAIVESILKNAGGRIYYETEVNKGSVFIVEVPVYKK